MRITGWHIDGFGVFREYRLEQLPPGLTILLGANEAGKTTLLAYLRGVLFGFPGGQRGKNFYPPMDGGIRGAVSPANQAQKQLDNDVDSPLRHRKKQGPR